MGKPTQNFVLDIMEWLRLTYDKETNSDTREEIIDAIEAITVQSVIEGVFEEPETSDGR